MSRPAEPAPGTVPPPPEPVTGRALVFSDLDGTLLDHDTYDFSAAVAALQLLRSRGVPLVLPRNCTRPEALESHRCELPVALVPAGIPGHGSFGSKEIKSGWESSSSAPPASSAPPSPIHQLELGDAGMELKSAS